MHGVKFNVPKIKQLMLSWWVVEQFHSVVQRFYTNDTAQQPEINFIPNVMKSE